MLYCPTVLILSQYFDRHRSIATAVATCGAGAGGIAFPYIPRFLLNVFGLDGALLLLAALIFNQSIFYALFQPIVIEDSTATAMSSSKSISSSVYIKKHKTKFLKTLKVLKNTKNLKTGDASMFTVKYNVNYILFIHFKRFIFTFL